MSLNKQPIEKAVRDSDGLELDLHSIFYTIQGEGPFAGTPAVFIRLAGCNLQCPMCDTEYTQGRRMASINEILDTVVDLHEGDGRNGYLVVITGGEPFRQPLTRLLNGLTHVGMYVQVESNGTLPPAKGVYYEKDTSRRRGSYIVCSPKTGKINLALEREACCVKYVLSADSVDPDDGLPIDALGHRSNPRLARPDPCWRGPIYLQPEDSKDEAENAANIKAVLNSCMKHGYILQLQIHKLLGME